MKNCNTALSDSIFCQVCGSALKLNLLEKNPKATKCFSCHKPDKNISFQISDDGDFMKVCLKCKPSKKAMAGAANKIFTSHMKASKITFVWWDDFEGCEKEVGEAHKAPFKITIF